jgi:hypothetical protein
VALNHRHFSFDATLADGQLENGHALRAEQAGIAHFGDHRGHFAGAQFGDRPRVQPVLVAKGQVMEQVVNRPNALGGKDLGEARADAFHELHWSGGFQHVHRW